jgi:hypothetical protein
MIKDRHQPLFSHEMCVILGLPDGWIKVGGGTAESAQSQDIRAHFI